eukprot:scaffold3120_cov167-Ochromonas_danica.AAC.8
MMSFAMTRKAFNPFTTRSRNKNVRWFEAELDLFFTFVEAQPLLTAEQELQLGKTLKIWQAIEKVRARLRCKREDPCEPISDEDLAKAIGCTVATLQKMTKYAEISKMRLLNSNLKLVLAIVSRYRTTNIPNTELISEGSRGLARAVTRYDYSKGFRFATYATWYVHQAVAEYVRWRKHLAKMPSRYLLLQRKVKQYCKEYKQKEGTMPSVSQMATDLGQSHYDIMKVLSMQSYPTLLFTSPQQKDSHKQGENQVRTLADAIPSSHTTPMGNIDRKDLHRGMELMMQTHLNDVERDILRLRLGLDDGRIKPVKEVGRRFKISWKQVRSVEKAAMSKLLQSEEIGNFIQIQNIERVSSPVSSI